MADRCVMRSVKSEKNDGFGLGGRQIIAIIRGLGQSNLKAVCSKDSIEGVEIGLTLRWHLKMEAIPPPLPVGRGRSMYLYPGGVAWLREKQSRWLCQVSVMQRKSRLLSVIKSFRINALLLMERVLWRASLRSCCWAPWCEMRGSRERLCRDRLTCLRFLMVGRGGLVVMMGRIGIFLAGELLSRFTCSLVLAK